MNLRCSSQPLMLFYRLRYLIIIVQIAFARVVSEKSYLFDKMHCTGDNFNIDLCIHMI